MNGVLTQGAINDYLQICSCEHGRTDPLPSGWNFRRYTDYHPSWRASTPPMLDHFEGGLAVLKKSLIIAAAVAPVVVVSAVAQQSNIKRTPLQTVDFPPGVQCGDRHR
jgi:hypothetical protein